MISARPVLVCLEVEGIRPRPPIIAWRSHQASAMSRRRPGQSSRPSRPDRDEHVVLRPDPRTVAAAHDVVRRTCTRSDDTPITPAEFLTVEPVEAAFILATGPLPDGAASELEQLRGAMASRATLEMTQGMVKAQQGLGHQAASPETRRRWSCPSREVRDAAEDLVLSFDLLSSAGDVW